MSAEVAFEHCGTHALSDKEDIISSLYEATHPGVIHTSFYDPGRFMERVRSYANAPAFEFVIASIAGSPVGLALGYPLPAGARWWRGLTTSVDPGLIEEDGTRTFALCELMTHPDWQGKGVGHQLHDELLFKRSEQRATLLVRADNDTARQAYERWGWTQLGKLKPFPDSPHYDALILDLTRK